MKPAVARIANSEIYLSPGTYDKLKSRPAAMRAVLGTRFAACQALRKCFRAGGIARPSGEHKARFERPEANGYFQDRSGDLFIVPKPYWLMSLSRPDKTRDRGTGHGTPYNYDQHVPVLLMGWGIEHGEFFRPITPADIAPTLASLCGITLATREGGYSLKR